MPLPRQEKTQSDGLPTQPVAAAGADAPDALQSHDADGKNAGPEPDAWDGVLFGSANSEPAVPIGRTDSERRDLVSDAPEREAGGGAANPKPDALVGGAGNAGDSEADAQDGESGGNSPERRWAEAAARARALREAREGHTKRAQPVRAINEDDDGYDPYSDFHDRNAGNPLFERDPWN